jgi:uncharacterized membrane protein YsdA (DUF1294 family)
MHNIIEAVTLVVMFTLYWCHRARRQYLKERIGSKALLNVYQVGRNIGFMLTRRDLHIRGDTSRVTKGCILYSWHFGVWELMPWALRKCGYALGIIVNQYSGRKKNYWARFWDTLLYWFRSRSGVKVFYSSDTRNIINFIRSGGLFGALVDGSTFYSKFNKIEKLGRLCGVPVIPFAAYRVGGTGVLEIGCTIDEIVKKRPYDYMWFYKSRR